MNHSTECPPSEPTAADQEDSVRDLYQDEQVAEGYIDERMRHTWWQHLHSVQVAAINRAIARTHAEKGGHGDVLEVAPGPARLTTELVGVHQGTMLEASPQMIAVAKRRLQEAAIDHLWTIIEGNAFDLSELPENFDLVYTFRFIRHFKQAERRRFYQQAAARLRPGGYLLFDLVGEQATAAERRRMGVQQGLDVYDVTYETPADIAKELAEDGFSLVELTPALKHFGLQSRLSYRLDSRMPGLVGFTIRMLEQMPSNHPLEWIGLFRKNS